MLQEFFAKKTFLGIDGGIDDAFAKLKQYESDEHVLLQALIFRLVANLNVAVRKIAERLQGKPAYKPQLLQSILQ